MHQIHGQNYNQICLFYLRFGITQINLQHYYISSRNSIFPDSKSTGISTKSLLPLVVIEDDTAPCINSRNLFMQPIGSDKVSIIKKVQETNTTHEVK